MRVAIYARFSSDLQNPASARDQIEALQDLIRRRHPTWRVVLTRADEALTGTTLEGRDGLAALLDLATKHPRPFDAVVVEDVSRLARNRSDAVRIRDGFAAGGVRVLSAADGFVDPESEHGLFLTGIRELKAEADSRETGRRTRRGACARTRQGWVSGRRAPFGYQRVAVFSSNEFDRDGRPVRLGVRFEPHPTEAAAVQLAFSRFAAGLGLRRVARELNEQQGPWRALKPAGYATSFLRSMFENPVYRGHVVYGRTRERKVRVGGRVRRRKDVLPESEWVISHDQHEPLVDAEVWEAVQARLRESSGQCIGRGNVKGGRRPASLLSGMVRCSCCGKNFVVWTSGRNPKQRRRGTGQTLRRFACNQARSSGGQLCTNSSTADVATLERATLDALEEAILTPAGLEELERQRRAFLEEALRESDGEARRLRAEAQRLRSEEGRMLDAIKAGLPLDGLRAEAQQIAEQRRSIQDRLEGIQELERATARGVQSHLRERPVRHLREVLSAPDLDEVRAALKDLILGVEAREDGSFWLLIGEGPLGSDDLARLPLAEGGNGTGSQTPQASPRRPGRAEAARGMTAAPDRLSAATGGSRICLVGATGLEPATS